MKIILLSGGSGKRLWPLSNDIRSKQFLQLFKRRDGEYESMIQQVYRQLNNIGIPVDVTIATSKNQVSAVYGQLGSDVDVCMEPSRKDTFAAIALSAAYLVDVKKVRPTEAVVACPVDPRVTSEYFRSLIALQYQAELEMANIILMGIVPTHATEKYGYIVPMNESKLAGVKTFKEKPTREAAKELIDKGALWNSGVFAFKLQYVLNKAKEILGYNTYDELLAHYESFPDVSFDVAVVEKEKSVQVMRFAGEWADMGTWNVLTESMSDPIIGNGVIDENSTGVQIVNELEVPILAMGLHDVVISASNDGILVSDKEMSSFIKPFVDKFEHTKKANKKIAEEKAKEQAEAQLKLSEVPAKEEAEKKEAEKKEAEKKDQPEERKDQPEERKEQPDIFEQIASMLEAQKKEPEQEERKAELDLDWGNPLLPENSEGLDSLQDLGDTVSMERPKEEESEPEFETVEFTSSIENRRWGSLKVIDADKESKTLKINLKAGSTMEYHSHLNHDEIWVVVGGEGQAILDEHKNPVKKGDIITMKAGCKHTVTAEKALSLIEIRLGNDLEAEDEKQYDLLVEMNAALMAGRILK